MCGCKKILSNGNSHIPKKPNNNITKKIRKVVIRKRG